MEEVWKDIVDYEGIYQISDMGRIRGFSKFGTTYLSLKPKKTGYVCVGLLKDGVRTDKRVHRLVASAFLPNPEKKPYVNHKKGIKHDNRVTELEWSTESENDIHAYQTGLRKSPKAWTGKTGHNHNRSKPVCQISITEETIQTFGSALEASRETGITAQNINKVLTGKRPTAGGYKWIYAN